LVVRNPGATTRRWLVVLLLVVAAVAAPVAGAEKPKAQKTIVVSVGQQMLWAYKGNKVVLSSYVSTGRAGFDTPIGSFAVLSKLPSQTMEGVIGGEYYNVPDVPWVLYFTNGGHALHGTYWHNNFGTPMSHGCVNLPLDVAAWLYDWAPVGTPVRIVA
jgi:lipoprotein-anchoring transpeptidase ErfK/SrfK